MTDEISKVYAGQRLQASKLNALIDQVNGLQTLVQQYGYSGGQGIHIQRPQIQDALMKWVVIRPPFEDDDIVIFMENAVPHPHSLEPGPDLGRWMTENELNNTTNPPDSVETWPHRTGKHYKEYAWDGETRVRETQILIAFFINDNWYPHPDPPFIMRRRPINDIQTPCTPQGLI